MRFWLCFILYVVMGFVTYGYLRHNPPLPQFEEPGDAVIIAMFWPAYWLGVGPLKWAAELSVDAMEWTKPDPCTNRFICKGTD